MTVPHAPYHTPVTTRTAMAVIRAFARIVPAHYRDRWREEWLGEIDAAPSGLRLIVRALGAIPDAALVTRTTALRAAGVPRRRRGAAASVPISRSACG